MKFQIVGKNISVTEAIRLAVEKKLNKMDKFFKGSDEEINARVVVRSYNIGAKVEVTIFTPHHDFRAEVQDEDLYDAIDKAVDKLEGQMRKVKTRLDRRKDKINLGEAIVMEAIESDIVEEENLQVVRSKSIYLQPMTLDMAIAKMESIGHSFFIYNDIDEERISVVYTRENGGYGVIEVENPLEK